jgi:hypothetical protein
MTTLLAILKVLPDLLVLLRAITEYMVRAEQREIGRQQALSEALTIAAEETRLAMEARFAAEIDHRAHPDNDSGFDQEFRRP